MRLILVQPEGAARPGLRELIESATSFEIVGEASSGRQAIELTRGTPPGVVVIQTPLPDFDGPTLVGRILEVSPSSVILFDGREIDPRIAPRLLDAGIAGFVLEDGHGKLCYRLLRPERI